MHHGLVPTMARTGVWRSPLRIVVCLSLLITPALLGACASGSDSEQPAGPVELDLDRADRQRLLGDHAGALEVYVRILATAADPESREALRARLGRADCRMNLGKLASGKLDAEMVRSTLRAEELDGLLEFAALEAEAERLLGDAELTAGLTIKARSHYNRALELVDAPSERDLLVYRLVICARHEGRRDVDEIHAGLMDRSRPQYAGLDTRFPAPERVQQEAFVPRQYEALASTRVHEESPPIAEGLALKPRSSWRALPIRSNRDRMSRIHRVTLHHSGTSFRSESEGTTASHLRSIQRHHQTSNGWADIAYHFLIDRAGRIWEGRSLVWQGAHAGNKSLNRGNIGICVLGDYRSQQLTGSQRASLTTLFDWIQDRYKVGAKGMYTHGEIRDQSGHGATACPGSELTRALHDYRDRARRRPFTAAR